MKPGVSPVRRARDSFDELHSRATPISGISTAGPVAPLAGKLLAVSAQLEIAGSAGCATTLRPGKIQDSLVNGAGYPSGIIFVASSNLISVLGEGHLAEIRLVSSAEIEIARLLG